MKTIIFGAGFTGTHLLKYTPDAISTELPNLCTKNQIPFDFNDPTSWKNIPSFDQAVITFKMTDTVLAEEFSKLFINKKTILLSSARNLLNTEVNEVISEKNHLSKKPRSLAERYFKDIATILYLGLIWGGERNLSKWISEGRIRNGAKFINLIHVDDLCRIISKLLENSRTIEKFLVSDGKPLKWSEIAKKKGLSLSSHDAGLESRKFNTDKLKATLPSDFQFQQV
ncbi:MAG: hypothetical protein NE328_07535 [Lentisphaeraceae bacterium]|nr:hypothetical protein [Lentisphaeraceae bacterium]